MSLYRAASALSLCSLVVLFLLVLCFPVIIPWLDARDVGMLALSDIDIIIGVCALVGVAMLLALLWVAQFPNADRETHTLRAILMLCFAFGAIVTMTRLYIGGVQYCHSEGRHALPTFSIESSGGFVRCGE